MSSIYFIVDNRLTTKVQIYLRGSFPHIYNNFSAWKEIAAGERKELSDPDERGWFATKFGYQAEFKIWGKVHYKGEVLSEGFLPVLVKNKNWDNFRNIDISSFANAPGGDINVTLTPTVLAVEGGVRHLTVDVSASIR